MNIPERCGFCLEEVSKHIFKIPCSEPEKVSCGPDTSEVVFGLAFGILKERNEVNDENRRLRKLLWASHGHTGLYGDDGEMQCAKCMLDYKSDSIETLETKRWDRAVKHMTENEVLREICKSLVIYDERGIGLLTHIIAKAVSFFNEEERRNRVIKGIK